jgi:hypothetical protein
MILEGIKMKKRLTIFSLVLVIAISVVAGTLAMYTTTIDALASGSVVAKEFVLTEAGSDTFAQNVKISPAETVTWQFGVQNYNGAIVSETAMDLTFAIDVTAATGKAAIAPLVVTVKDASNNIVGTQTGTGEISFTDSFPLSGTGQSKTYTVQINWPSNNAVDINYAGSGFGTALAVTVTGTQA